jgi:hypothetical protein
VNKIEDVASAASAKRRAELTSEPLIAIKIF